MRRTRPLALALLFLLAALPYTNLPAPLAPPTAGAVPFTLPPGFTDELMLGGLVGATAMDWAPDGRLFIAQKGGVVRVATAAGLLAPPFVDISAEVNSYWDRGLLGIAVHPQFPAQPYVYLLYTHDPPGLLGAPGAANGRDGEGARVSQLLRVAADPATGYATALPADAPEARRVILGSNSTLANIGNPASYKEVANASCLDDASGVFVRDCIPSDGRAHSVGQVAFGPDGMLYVSSGDASDWDLGTSGPDLRALNVQRLDAMNGKLLRIDPLSGAGLADNPFYDGDPQSNRSRVYAYGLRNPFRFSFHPTSGAPYIGDVGDGNWEEVNVGRGANFGWPCYEGGLQAGVFRSLPRTAFQSQPVCTQLYAANTGGTAATPPLLAYPHGTGLPAPVDSAGQNVIGKSITLGDFYTGQVYPAAYRGGLFLSDFNNEWWKVLGSDGTTVSHFATDTPLALYDGVVQLRAGPDTNLYYIYFKANGSNNNSGLLANSEIRRIRYTEGGNTPPRARLSASPTTGSYPLTVSFSATGSTDPDAQTLSYSWDFGDGASASGLEVSHTYTTPGSFSATLTVSDGAGGSDSRSVAITAGNTAPVAQIVSPAEGARYAVGDRISFSGTASDAEDGTLTAASLRWEVLLRHNEHVHGDFFSATGLTGSFEAPDHGDGTALELCLTAVDSRGLASVPVCRELPPRTVRYSFTSDPPGVTLTYGVQDMVTPFSVDTVVGSTTLLAALLTQQQRSFDAWAHGGPVEQYLTVGAEPRSFHASYANRLPLALPAATMDGGQWPVTVTFNATLSYDPEQAGLTYRWDFGDGAGAVGPLPSHRYARPGSYVATLTVTDELGASASEAVAIAIANTPPVARLDQLSAGSYAVGDSIHFGGGGSDTEDGALDGDGLVWQVIRHTASTSETLLNTVGAGGSFRVPDNPDDTAIEIRLTVRDSNGGTDTRSVSLTPRRSTLTLVSEPPGATLLVNGVAQASPLSLTATVGASVELEALASHAGRGFAGWSSGAGRAHTLHVPGSSATLTAHYGVVSPPGNRLHLPLLRL